MYIFDYHLIYATSAAAQKKLSINYYILVYTDERCGVGQYYMGLILKQNKNEKRRN